MFLLYLLFHNIKLFKGTVHGPFFRAILIISVFFSHSISFNQLTVLLFANSNRPSNATVFAFVCIRFTLSKFASRVKILYLWDER
jgi:hypothetical protein